VYKHENDPESNQVRVRKDINRTWLGEIAQPHLVQFAVNMRPWRKGTWHEQT